jgi:hypothetical protein
MTKSEIFSCLRILQVVPTVTELPKETLKELVEKELIERTSKGYIRLTQLGVLTKTGQV